MRRAVLVAKRRFNSSKIESNLPSISKGPQDYVSEADRLVEKMIISHLKAFFPDDGFLGEESGEVHNVRQWVIDPIDGTTNFIRGLPYFCTTLALVENEKVVGGWIYDPTRDEMYEATLDGGAYCNGNKLDPSGVLALPPDWSVFVTVRD